MQERRYFRTLEQLEVQRELKKNLHVEDKPYCLVLYSQYDDKWDVVFFSRAETAEKYADLVLDEYDEYFVAPVENPRHMIRDKDEEQRHLDFTEILHRRITRLEKP